MGLCDADLSLYLCIAVYNAVLGYTWDALEAVQQYLREEVSHFKYRQISNVRCTNTQNFNVSRLVFAQAIAIDARH